MLRLHHSEPDRLRRMLHLQHFWGEAQLQGVL